MNSLEDFDDDNDVDYVPIGIYLLFITFSTPFWRDEQSRWKEIDSETGAILKLFNVCSNFC